MVAFQTARQMNDTARRPQHAVRRTGANEQILREALEFCARVCEDCAAECEKHDHEHCKLCAQMCRECAADCRTAAESI